MIEPGSELDKALDVMVECRFSCERPPEEVFDLIDPRNGEHMTTLGFRVTRRAEGILGRPRLGTMDYDIWYGGAPPLPGEEAR